MKFYLFTNRYKVKKRLTIMMIDADKFPFFDNEPIYLNMCLV